MKASTTSEKGDNGGANLFPRRRRRHFTSGLASRLFASSEDNVVGANNQVSFRAQQNHQQQQQRDTNNEQGRRSPPTRGGLRRDRLGNVVGHFNHHHHNNNTVTSTPLNEKSKPPSRSNSPRTISSRKSTRTDQTDPIDNSFASSSPSPGRGTDNDSPAWYQQRPITPTNVPYRSQLRRGGGGGGTPLAESMDRYEEIPATAPFLVFPATSPHRDVVANRFPNIAAANIRGQIPHLQFEDDTESSLSNSIDKKDSSGGESSSRSASPYDEHPVRPSPIAPLQFRASPLEQQMQPLQQHQQQIQQHSAPAIKQNTSSPGRRVAEWLSNTTNTQISMRTEGASGLARSWDQGIEMLLNPVQKWVQCATPQSPDNNKLAQPIPLQKISSTVSGASTEVATNRGVDIAKRRIREMEEQIELRRQEAAEEQRRLQRQRERQHEFDQIADSHEEYEEIPSDEDVIVIQKQGLQTRPPARFYRNGQEDEGDQPPSSQRTVFYRSRLSFGEPKIAPRQLEQKSILSVSDDDSSRMTHSTAQSHQQQQQQQQQQPIKNTSPIVAGPPTTIVPKRRKALVDLVPAQRQEHGGSGENASLQSVSQSSSMKVEVHRNQVDKSRARDFFAGVRSGELQPLQESTSEEYFVQSTSEKKNPDRPDLMLPILSPFRESNDEANSQRIAETLVTTPTTTEAILTSKSMGRYFPTSPKSDGAVFMNSSQKSPLSVIAPKSDFGPRGRRVTQTRPVEGGFYLSPPRASGRIPQVGMDSPDPVFCSKSITSSTPTSLYTATTSSPAGVLNRDYSFDSSIMNQSKPNPGAVKKAISPVKKAQGAAPHAAYRSESSYSHGIGPKIVARPRAIETTGSSSFQDRLSLFQKSAVSKQTKEFPQTADRTVQSVETVPTLAELAAISAYARDQSPSEDQPSLDSVGSGEKTDESNDVSSGPSCDRMENGRPSVENLSQRWPPKAVNKPDTAYDSLDESQNGKENCDEEVQESSLYRSTPAWAVMKSLRHERQHPSATDGTSISKHTVNDKSSFRHQADTMASSYNSSTDSLKTAVSIFEKKHSVKEYPTPGGKSMATRKYSKLGDLISHERPNKHSAVNTEELSVGVRSLRSAFESLASRSLQEPDNDDNDDDDDTASVKSLRDKFEGATKNVGYSLKGEEDDDTASVKSLRDKFEGTTKNVDSGVTKMREMFEAKSRRSTKPFQSGKAELQEAFSRFQSKQNAKEKAKRYLGVTNRSRPQKSNEQGVGPPISSRCSQAPKGDNSGSPETSQLSVAERAKSFSSLSRVTPQSSVKRLKDLPEKIAPRTWKTLPVKSPETTPAVRAVEASKEAPVLVRWRKPTTVPEHETRESKNMQRPDQHTVNSPRPKTSENTTARLDRSRTAPAQKPLQSFTSSSLVSDERKFKPENSDAERAPAKSPGRERLAQAAIAAKSNTPPLRTNRFASLTMVAHRRSPRSSLVSSMRETEIAEPAKVEQEAVYLVSEAPRAPASKLFPHHDFTPPDKVPSSGSPPRNRTASEKRTIEPSNGRTSREEVNSHTLSSVHFRTKSTGQNEPQGSGGPLGSSLNRTSKPTIEPSSHPRSDTGTERVKSIALSSDQKERYSHAASNAQPTKDKSGETDSAISGSESDFSDGVTLDVSIADVSGLTIPTVLAEKSASTTDARDEETSSGVSTKMDARRSEASSSQTSEILAPLIARAMRTSDESSMGESFFAARAVIAEKKQHGWNAKISEPLRRDDAVHMEEKKTDECDSAGWDGNQVQSMFPRKTPAALEIFQFDSEWRSLAPVPSFASVPATDAIGNRSTVQTSRAPATNNRESHIRERFQTEQPPLETSSKQSPPVRQMSNVPSSFGVGNRLTSLNSLKYYNGSMAHKTSGVSRNETPMEQTGNSKGEQSQGNSPKETLRAFHRNIVAVDPVHSDQYEKANSSSFEVSSRGRFVRSPPSIEASASNHRGADQTHERTEETKQLSAISPRSSRLNGLMPRMYRNTKSESMLQPEAQALLPRIPEVAEATEQGNPTSATARRFGYKQSVLSQKPPKVPTTAMRDRFGNLQNGVPGYGGKADVQNAGTVMSDNAAMAARLRILKESRIRRVNAHFFGSPESEEVSCSTKSSTQFGGTHFNEVLKVD